MRKIRVLLSFTKLSVSVKIEFFRNVITKMTLHKDVFVTPDRTMADAADVLDNLEEKSLAAKDGGHSATVALRTAEKAADELFKVLAIYVDRIAKGDESIILLAGYEGSKQPVPVTKPELRADDGSNSGTIRLVAKAVKSAGAYIWQMAKDSIPVDGKEWTVAGYSKQSSYEVSNLPVGGIYYFRVAAIISEGLTDYTAPIMKVIV
jgi:hypothetical protein